MKQWQIKNIEGKVGYDALLKNLDFYSKKFKVSPLILQVLFGRDMDMQEIEKFLYPSLKSLGRFSEYNGLQESGDAVLQAIQDGKKIAIWGDYDVDGITSSSLLYEFFYEAGLDLPYVYYSDRFLDGYGLNERGIRYLAENGYDFIITVDCGITSIEEVSLARSLGIEMVITDHHLPKGDIPNALGVFNPRLCNECPCADLAGVGVAFYLASYLHKIHYPNVDMMQFLDLVALGTIADMVKIRGDNRTLTKFGMKGLNNGDRFGIAALKEARGMHKNDVMTAGQIAFRIAPAINAAGRLDDPRKAFELLTTRDKDKAKELGQELHNLNTQRQDIERNILEEAREQAKKQKDDYSIVVYGENWHKGVIGIVASNIVEEFYLPTLILTSDDDFYSGSGRSIPDLDLHKALMQCESLYSFGGHKQAAGMKVYKKNIDALKNDLEKAVQDQLGDEMPVPKQRVDMQIQESEISYHLVKNLEMMEPFGIGNPKPVFAVRNMEIDKWNYFGKQNNHLFLQLKSSKQSDKLKCKGWRMGGDYRLKSGDKVDIAGTLELNNFNGFINVEFKIEDLQQLVEN